MSRVGKLPISVPKDVQVELTGADVVIKGKQGVLRTHVLPHVKISLDNGEAGQQLKVEPANDENTTRAMWGTMRNLLNNMVKGVTEGFAIRLEVKGVGYRAAVKGKFLALTLGFSHDIYYAIPEGIQIVCEKPTLVVISGADKQLVGQVAGEIMSFRPVEPYKGKGVFIEGSYIRRKEGKKK